MHPTYPPSWQRRFYRVYRVFTIYRFLKGFTGFLQLFTEFVQSLRRDTPTRRRFLCACLSNYTGQVQMVT